MTTQTETRTLSAHEHLVYDVITRQAGTLQKAVCEGTMNAIEAKTPEIHITLWEENNKAFLDIKDEGVGISTEEEIIEHFEKFGTPHNDNEDKTWAEFRMGRGQMFAFGKNTWRTSQFEMVVDIKEWGLNYELRRGLPEVSGCHILIDLYDNPIGAWQIPSIEAFKELVQEQVRFVKTPVYFNNERISVDPSTLDWTEEDKDAYYLFNANSVLKTYNLGIKVMDTALSQAGVGGIVVSKKKLQVNFARNDVQSTCGVFGRIKKVIHNNKIKRANTYYQSMGNGERYALLRDIRDASSPFYQLNGKRVLRTAQGKWITLKMFDKDTRPWTITDEGSRSADKAMEQNTALCFSRDMLDELGYSGKDENFFKWLLKEHKRDLQEGYDYYGLGELLKRKAETYIPESQLQNLYKEDYRLAPKMTKVEKRIIQALNGCGCWQNRRFSVGLSSVAWAWTDGSTYIVLERNFLKNLNLSSDSGIYQLFKVCVHELAHTTNTAGSHIHGPDFYESHYDIVHNSNYWQNPFIQSYSFKDKIKKLAIEAKKEKQEEEDRKALEKLGAVA